MESLVDTVQVLIVVLDIEGRIVFFNRVCQETTGYSAEEVLGRNWFDLFLPERIKEEAGEVFQKLLDDQLPSHYENPILTKDGQERLIEWDHTLLCDEEGTVRHVIGTGRDITEHKRVEETLRRSQNKTVRGHRLLLALSQAAQGVQRARTPDEVYRTVGEEVAGLSYNAAIFTLTDDRAHLAIPHLNFEPTLVRAAEKLVGLSAQDFRFPLVSGGFYQRIIAEGETTFRESFTEPIAEALPRPVRPLAVRVAALLGIEQGIVARLTVGGETHGLLVVTGAGLTEADVPAVSAFASQTAIALENTRLYQEAEQRAKALRESEEELRKHRDRLEKLIGERTAELRGANEQLQQEIDERRRAEEALARHNRELAALNAVVAVVSRSLRLEEVAQQAIDLIHQRLGYTNVALLLVDKQAGELYIKAACGYPQDVQGLRLKIGQEGITGWVAAHREPLLVPDVRQDPRYVMGAEEIRSELAVPVMLGEELLGVLDVESNRVAAFGEDDRRTLTTLAGQIAVAIGNARLYEQVADLAADLEVRVQERTAEMIRKARDLSLLYQVGVALSSSLEVEEVLKALARQAALAVDAVDCTICELQDDALVVVASYWDPAIPWKDSEIGRRYLLADYPATREAIEKGQPLRVRVDDLLADEAERAELQELGYTALLQVHIFSRGQVVGVVEVFDNKPEREFSEGDAALLQTIANQAGMAIERARLFQQVREERNHLELLYEVSRKLSASLDLEQTLRDIVQVSTAITGASRGSVFVFDDEGQVSHRILTRDLSPAEADDAPDRVLRKGLAAWVFEHKQPAIVFDTSRDERWLPFPGDAEPAGSAMTIPFIERDQVRGGLTLVHPQPSYFNQTHLELLSSIANQIAVVVERARLHEHARRRAIQLATAAEVSSDATSTLDVGQLLTRTVGLIRDRFDLYYVGVFLVDEAGEYAVLHAGTGEAGQQMLKQDHKLKVGGTSMVGQCVANAKACIALDANEEASRFDNPLLPETRTEVALPLISRGRVIGAMTIQSDRPAAFSNEDIAALQTLADQLANAIENARLYEETRRRAQEVAQQKEQTDAIVQSMADGLIVTDLENRIVLANPAAEELLKFRLQDAIGQEIGANIRDDRLRQIVRDTLDKQQAGYEVDIELTDPYDGAQRIIRAHTAVVNDPSGQSMGIVTTLRDVTHEREVQRLKDELISTVSHELRTPMTSVLGFSELLLSHQLSEKQRQLYMQTIHKEAQRLSALINDFLDIQRMERGQQEYHFEEVDLSELVREMVVAYSGQSEAHTLTLDLPPELPPVQADPDRLKQVLGNLLSNAIKFSPDGGTVRVSAQVWGDTIRVAVSDEGIGIPAEALSHVFEKFFRVDSSDQREIKGTGLGLAICKEIVEAHGGDIWAESQEGVGTTVIFSLPMGIRKRILAIDDEKI